MSLPRSITASDTSWPLVVDSLRRRARALEPADLALLEMVWAGQHQRQIAALVGRSPGSVSRRVRRLRDRLQLPIVKALIDHADALPPLIRTIGIERHLHGHSRTALAQRHHQRRVDIDKALNYIEAWFRAAS